MNDQGIQRVTRLLHSRVANRRGDLLGRIDDLVIDLQTGAIAYAVLRVPATGGPAKYFSIPWSSLEGAPPTILLDMDRRTFVSASGLRWPPAPKGL